MYLRKKRLLLQWFLVTKKDTNNILGFYALLFLLCSAATGRKMIQPHYVRQLMSTCLIGVYRILIKEASPEYLPWIKIPNQLLKSSIIFVVKGYKMFWFWRYRWLSLTHPPFIILVSILLLISWSVLGSFKKGADRLRSWEMEKY